MRSLLMFSLLTSGLYSNAASKLENKPAEPIASYFGTDKRDGSVCTLDVLEIGHDGEPKSEGNWYANVTTSYQHGSEKSPAMKLRQKVSSKFLYVGKNRDSDQIAVWSNKELENANTLTQFNLKWLHGDHFHTEVCLNLTLFKK